MTTSTKRSPALAAGAVITGLALAAGAAAPASEREPGFDPRGVGAPVLAPANPLSQPLAVAQLIHQAARTSVEAGPL